MEKSEKTVKILRLEPEFNDKIIRIPRNKSKLEVRILRKT